MSGSKRHNKNEKTWQSGRRYSECKKLTKISIQNRLLKLQIKSKGKQPSRKIEKRYEKAVHRRGNTNGQ